MDVVVVRFEPFMMIHTEAWFKAGGLTEDFQRLLRELAGSPANTDALLQLAQLSERSGLEIPPEILEPAVRAWVARVKALPSTVENLQAFKDLLQAKWPLSRYVDPKDERPIRSKIVEILGQQHAQEGGSVGAVTKLWHEALGVRRLPPISWELVKRVRNPLVTLYFAVMSEVRGVDPQRSHPPGDASSVFAGEGFMAPGGKRNMGGPDDPHNRWAQSLLSFFRGLKKAGYQPDPEYLFEKEVAYPPEARGRASLRPIVDDWIQGPATLVETLRPHLLGIRVENKQYLAPSYDDPMWHRWFQEA